VRCDRVAITRTAVGLPARGPRCPAHPARCNQVPARARTVVQSNCLRKLVHVDARCRRGLLERVAEPAGGERRQKKGITFGSRSSLSFSASSTFRRTKSTACIVRRSERDQPSGHDDHTAFAFGCRSLGAGNSSPSQCCESVEHALRRPSQASEGRPAWPPRSERR